MNSEAACVVLCVDETIFISKERLKALEEKAEKKNVKFLCVRLNTVPLPTASQQIDQDNLTWEGAILKSIANLQGRANLSQIYTTVGNFYPLTPKHKRQSDYGNCPAFQHQVRAHINNLKKKKQIEKIGRATYALTPKGSARLRNG